MAIVRLALKFLHSSWDVSQCGNREPNGTPLAQSLHRPSYATWLGKTGMCKKLCLHIWTCSTGQFSLFWHQNVLLIFGHGLSVVLENSWTGSLVSSVVGWEVVRFLIHEAEWKTIKETATGRDWCTFHGTLSSSQRRIITAKQDWLSPIWLPTSLPDLSITWMFHLLWSSQQSPHHAIWTLQICELINIFFHW